MTLSGIDVSNHQSSSTLADWLPKSSFVIVKASEGRTFKDPSHDSHVASARAAGRLVGHYHFARPDNNTGQAEADFFVATAKARPGEVLVLDFEPYNHPINMAYAPEWILAFMARVEFLTKAPCWLYIDGNMGTKVLGQATVAQAVAIRSRPLWKATYGSTPGNLLGWSMLTAWQFTSAPVDRNTFYGNADTWKRLGVPSPVAPPPPPVTKPLQVDGKFGAATISRLQTRLRQVKASDYQGKQIQVTGTWTDRDSYALSRYLNYRAQLRHYDPKPRSKTLRPGPTLTAYDGVHILRLEFFCGVDPRKAGRVWDSDTTSALQRALNAGTF
jgi:GH25 family lysozyme M1 (1,4-beta-N-acetylmuramidase)